MLGPCRDLVMANRMANWLSGMTRGNGHGNIEWFEQKGDVALTGLLFAAAVSGATVADVSAGSSSTAASRPSRPSPSTSRGVVFLPVADARGVVM